MCRLQVHWFMHYSVLCLKREGKHSGSRNLGFCCTQGATPAVNNRVWSDLFGSRQPLFAVLHYLNILICISHFLQLPSGGFQLLISLGMTEAIPHSGRDPTASPFLSPVGETGESTLFWFCLPPLNIPLPQFLLSSEIPNHNPLCTTLLSDEHTEHFRQVIYLHESAKTSQFSVAFTSSTAADPYGQSLAAYHLICPQTWMSGCIFHFSYMRNLSLKRLKGKLLGRTDDLDFLICAPRLLQSELKF